MAGVDHYYLWLTDQTSGAVTQATNLTGTTWTASAALTLGHQYTWWAGAVGSDGSTAWSSGQNFTMAPQASGPSGSSATTQPTFNWIGVAGADHYYVWLTDQTTGTSLQVSNVSVTRWTPSAPLLLAHQYQWWVAAVGVDGSIAWNNGQTFDMAPRASGPNGAVATTQPAITWSAVTGADHYYVWLADQTMGTNVQVPNLAGTSWTPTAALTLGHQYMWWVGAVGTDGSTAWNDGLAFTIAPLASGPRGTLTTSLPIFTWIPVAGADHYDLWLTDQTTGDILQVTNVAGTSWTPESGLSAGHAYIWWVAAISAAGDTGWDAGLAFTITQ